MSAKHKKAVQTSSAATGLPPEIGVIAYIAGVSTGVSADGRLLHSIKSPDWDGSALPWTAFDDVEATAGEAGSLVDVAIRIGSAPRSFGTHILAVDSVGGLHRTFRERGYESWAPFEDVKAKAGDPGAFVRIAAGGMIGELHLCGLTSDGLLWHTIRRDDGSWEPFFDIGSEAGDVGTPVRVACHGYQRRASVDGLLLFVVSDDGRLWSTTRRQSDGHWTPFVDIKKPGRAGDPGHFIDVDCGAASGEKEVHVCGVTDDGRMWHAIRREDTSWKKRFTDIEATAGEKGTFINVATATYLGSGLSVAGATSDGHLWRANYNPRVDGFTPFEDVVAEAGSSGIFTSVALEYAYLPG